MGQMEVTGEVLAALGYDDAERAAALLRGARARGFSISGLVKPRTVKQWARNFMRWRKRKAIKDG